jgi:hypothetical protein
MDSLSPLDQAPALLGGAIAQLSRLSVLSLEHCFLADTGAQRLARCLPALPRLARIELQGNDVHEEAAEVLLRALQGLPLQQGVSILHSD